MNTKLPGMPDGNRRTTDLIRNMQTGQPMSRAHTGFGGRTITISKGRHNLLSATVQESQTWRLREAEAELRLATSQRKLWYMDHACHPGSAVRGARGKNGMLEKST